MPYNQYQVLFNTAAGSALVQLGGNLTVHTINFPKATTGLIYLTTATGSGTTILWTIPIGAIGSHIFDAGFATGLGIGAVAADAYSVTYQKP